jgi:hypothetical protein
MRAARASELVAHARAKGEELACGLMPGKGAFACAKHAVIMWPCVGTKMSAPARPCALSEATLMWQSNA